MNDRTTAVKLVAMSDDTATVAGYGVVFGGRDLYGETFSSDTDFMLDLVPSKLVLYDHGMSDHVRGIIGRVTKVAMDESGLWIEAELQRHAEYMAQVLELIGQGALGWSSGTAGHLAERSDNFIRRWPIIEFSLTPTPAEPRTLGVEQIKALTESDASFGALLPEGDAATSPASADEATEIDAIDTDAVSAPEGQEDTQVTEEVKTAAVDPTLAALLAKFEKFEAELSAVKSALDAEPPVNVVNVSTPNLNLKTRRGDDETKAFAHYLRTGDGGGLGSKAYNNTDMNIGTQADGGYAVPTGLYNQIVARRDELSLVPKLGLRNIPGKGLTVNVTVDDEADVLFASVAEAGAINQDAPALNTKAFTLVKYAKYITLSWELLRDEDANLMAFVNDWVARGVAATENSLLIAAALAGGTAGLTLDAAAAIGAAEIPELEGKLMPEYQDGAQWIMHPTTYSYIRQIFGTSQFVFAPGVNGAPPGFGYPVNLSSYATALAASAKSLIFGNFNFMGFRRGTSLQVLNDPYTGAGTGQTKMWFWFDAVFAVLQAEAIQYATHPSA